MMLSNMTFEALHFRTRRWRGAVLTLGAFVLFSTPLPPNTDQAASSSTSDGHAALTDQPALLVPALVEAAPAEVDCRVLASTPSAIPTWNPPGPNPSACRPATG